MNDNGWITALLGAIFGVGGATLLRVWLESRRLSNGEFRQTLIDRIRELEGHVEILQTLVGDLKGETARLESDNCHLRKRLEEISGSDPKGPSDGVAVPR